VDIVEAVAQTGAADDRLLASDDSLAARERKRLLERELARYLLLLAEHRDPDQVIVFGSLASGDIQPWSDMTS
jgi:hypothetical protein